MQTADLVTISDHWDILYTPETGLTDFLKREYECISASKSIYPNTKLANVDSELKRIISAISSHANLFNRKSILPARKQTPPCYHLTASLEI